MKGERHSYIKNAWETIKEFVSTTSAKITFGAILVGAITTLVSYKYETQRSSSIPLAFSEVTQIEKDAASVGTHLENINRYLPKVNDCAMKIFESWNLAHGVMTQEKGIGPDSAKEMMKNVKQYSNLFGKFEEGKTPDKLYCC
ncbi:hypothetical protein FJZ18_02470 [Candidatus Pacearchaeota archaeon]|nr:hypothetical protein [Candidatus Pacearchaeota archaeon]